MRKTFTRITAILAVLFFSAWGVNAQLTTIVNSNFTNWTVSEDNNIDLSEKSVLDLNNIVVTGGNKTFNIPTAKNDIENIFEIKFETGATVPTIIFNFATANTSLKKNYSTIPTNSRIRLIITQSKSGVGFWNSEINLIQFAN